MTDNLNLKQIYRYGNLMIKKDLNTSVVSGDGQSGEYCYIVIIDQMNQ